MHKTENKSLWKEEKSYGGDIWYMGRTFEELKNYACGWLIFICIIIRITYELIFRPPN